MTAQVTIRTAVEQDIDQLVNLLELLFAIETDFSFDPVKHKMGLEMMLADGSTRFVCVAEVDHHHIIGMCSVQLVVSTAEGSLSALVEDMVIDPDFHKQGVGRKLMDTVFAWCRQNGTSRLQLLADSDNTGAMAFYKKTDWCATQLICLRHRLT